MSHGMRHGITPSHHRTVRALAAAALAVGLTACGAPVYRYTANDADDLVLKVPRSWNLVRSGVPPLQDGTPAPAGNWYAIYDAAPHPDVKHAGAPHTTDPVAWVQTFVVTKEQAAGLTDDDLRDILVPVSDAGRTSALLQGSFAGGAFRLFSDQKVTTRTATGVHVVFSYDLGNGAETFDKIVMLDRRQTRVHLLLVQCSKACYARDQRVIADSVRSFTVRTA